MSHQLNINTDINVSHHICLYYWLQSPKFVNQVGIRMPAFPKDVVENVPGAR